MSNNHFTQASYNAGTRVNQYQKDCRIGKWCQKSSCQYFAIPSFRCPFAFLLLYSCYPFAIPHHCKNPDPGIPLGFLAPISGQMDCGQMGDRKYDLSLKVRKKIWVLLLGPSAMGYQADITSRISCCRLYLHVGHQHSARCIHFGIHLWCRNLHCLRPGFKKY